MTTTDTERTATTGIVAVAPSESDQSEEAEDSIVAQSETANGEENGEVLEELDLVFQYLPKEGLRRGDIIDGIVLDSARDGLLVDIQQKSEGWVPIRETRLLTDEEGEEALPQIGDEVILYVSRPEGPDGYPMLSIDRARGEHGWRDLEKAREAEETVRGRIIGSNRGGAVIQVKGVQGFVPLSQLVDLHVIFTLVMVHRPNLGSSVWRSTARFLSSTDAGIEQSSPNVQPLRQSTTCKKCDLFKS